VLHERVQAVSRLIEDEQLGVEEECEQECDLAPVAAREVGQMAVEVEAESLGELVATRRLEAAPQTADASYELHAR
jgi:hypothetical protein